MRSYSWPGTDNALLAGFPVGVFSLQGEACFDGKVKAGFVLEVDADVVMIGGGRKLHLLDHLTFGLANVPVCRGWSTAMRYTVIKCLSFGGANVAGTQRIA